MIDPSIDWAALLQHALLVPASPNILSDTLSVSLGETPIRDSWLILACVDSGSSQST
jgi:hypothetical protein